MITIRLLRQFSAARAKGKSGMEQRRRMPDSGNGRSNSPLSPFPPVQSQTHEPTGDNRGNRDGWKVNIRACPIQVMADLFLRYLRFLLFNPKPMNQQEGKERTEGDEATLRDAIATITRVRSSARFWSASAPACTLYVSSATKMFPAPLGAPCL